LAERKEDEARPHLHHKWYDAARKPINAAVKAAREENVMENCPGETQAVSDAGMK
jgi:hypothetical protein